MDLQSIFWLYLLAVSALVLLVHFCCCRPHRAIHEPYDPPQEHWDAVAREMSGWWIANILKTAVIPVALLFAIKSIKWMWYA